MQGEVTRLITGRAGRGWGRAEKQAWRWPAYAESDQNQQSWVDLRQPLQRRQRPRRSGLRSASAGATTICGGLGGVMAARRGARSDDCGHPARPMPERPVGRCGRCHGIGRGPQCSPSCALQRPWITSRVRTLCRSRPGSSDNQCSVMGDVVPDQARRSKIPGIVPIEDPMRQRRPRSRRSLSTCPWNQDSRIASITVTDLDGASSPCWASRRPKRH